MPKVKNEFPPVEPKPAQSYPEYKPDAATRLAQARARKDQPPMQALVSSTSNIPLWEK